MDTRYGTVNAVHDNTCHCICLTQDNDVSLMLKQFGVPTCNNFVFVFREIFGTVLYNLCRFETCNNIRCGTTFVPQMIITHDGWMVYERNTIRYALLGQFYIGKTLLQESVRDRSKFTWGRGGPKQGKGVWFFIGHREGQCVLSLIYIYSSACIFLINNELTYF